MTYGYDDLKILNTIESEFINEIKDKNIKVLRDLFITGDEYNEIKDLLRKVFSKNALIHYGKVYPVSISVFLVFCGVTHYKDGDLWEQVFYELDIEYTENKRKILGDVFLGIIKRYDLLSLDSNVGNKYVSPILMHGYISNYYSSRFFDRMNIIYEVILDGNVSSHNIMDNWDEVFRVEDDKDISTYKKERKKLEETLGDLSKELEQYVIDEELQDKSKEVINSLVKDTKSIEIENQLELIRIDQLKDEEFLIVENRNEIESIIELTNNIRSNTGISEAKIIVDYIYLISTEIEKDINKKYIDIVTRNRDLKIKINNDMNRITINKGKIREIQTKVSILGSGNLDDGWSILSEYNELKKKFQSKKEKFVKLEKKIKLKENSLNTSFIQIYTAALYNLKLTSGTIFISFIISTLKMMDNYFKNNKINEEHILLSEFIKWYNSPETKDKRAIHIKHDFEGSLDNKPTKNLSLNKLVPINPRIANIKTPYFRLNLSSWKIELIIPEQTLKIGFKPDNNPTYVILNKNNKEQLIEASTKTDGEFILIHEISLEVDPESISGLIFKWFNRREVFNLELNPVIIFNSEGIMQNRTVVNNGIYYILCHESWELSEGYSIDEFYSNTKGYKIYEILLEESSILFTSKSSSQMLQIISSRYSHIHMENLRIIEGITIGNLEILQDYLPSIKYNNNLIDDKEMIVSIIINNKIMIHKRMNEIADAHSANDDIKIIDISKLKLETYTYPARFRILILDANNNEIYDKEYYWIKGTLLKFVEDELFVNIPIKSKLVHPKSKMEENHYIIPLEASPYEEIRIWYNEIGWILFMVEVPNISVKIIDENDNEIKMNKYILKNELVSMKDYKIVFETNGRSIRYIQISNLNGNIDTILPLKNNYSDLKLDLIIDSISLTDEKDTLSYNWISKDRKSKEISIFSAYSKWIISNIKVFQEELDQEFVLEVIFDCNFNYMGDKRIRMINGEKIIFDKNIEEENPYYYIKKDSLVNDNICIEIYYKENSTKRLFMKNKDIVAGSFNLILKSRSMEMKNIKKYGIIISDFKYGRDSFNLLYPFTIDNIEEGQALNFIGEKIYKGTANIRNRSEEVIFYIDIDKRELPLLLDIDRDGAQYDKDTGEVFWDLRRNKNVLAPIEYFKYKIKEGD